MHTPEKEVHGENLEAAYPAIVSKMRQWNRKMIPSALGVLENYRLAQVTVAMVAVSILQYPQNVEILGKPVLRMSKRDRGRFAENVLLVGHKLFPSWYNAHVSQEQDVAVIERIIGKNTRHCAHWWYESHHGGFPEPDWRQLSRSHKVMESGRFDTLDPLYVHLFKGLHISTVEVFLEDELPVIGK